MTEAKALYENEQIKKLVPLNTLPESVLRDLLMLTEIEKAFKGAFLFQAGDIDQENVYLLSGEVALLDAKREVDRIQSPSEVARFPLSHQFPRKYSARATRAVSFIRIDNRKLSVMLSRSQIAGYKVEELDTGEPGDWMDQLLGSRVVQMMPTANIQEVLRHMEKVDLGKGNVVFNQGDEGDFYYFISEGRCRLTRVAEPGGESEEIAQLGPGDSFGEDALLSGSPRSCTISMLSDGVLLRLSKENFLDLVKKPLSRSYSYGAAKLEVSAGATWLDVRPAAAHDKAHLPGSINLPFDLLRYQMSSLDVDREYVVYCADAGLSSAAAYLLAERGFKVAVLKRGLNAVLPRDLVSGRAKAPGRSREALLEEQETYSPQDTHDEEAAPPLADRQPPATDKVKGDAPEKLLEAERRRAEDLARLVDDQAAHWRERERGYLETISELEHMLAAAQSAAPKVEPTRASASDDSALSRALQKAEEKLAALTKEYEESEELHAQETDEMHRLWEKRLGKLEAQLAEQQNQLREALREKEEAELKLSALREQGGG